MSIEKLKSRALKIDLTNLSDLEKKELNETLSRLPKVSESLVLSKEVQSQIENEINQDVEFRLKY